MIKDAKKACKKSYAGNGAVAFEFAQVRQLLRDVQAYCKLGFSFLLGST